MNTEKNQSVFRFSNPALLEAIYIANPNYNGKMEDVGTTPLRVNVKISQKKKNQNDDTVATVAESVMTSEAVDQSENAPYYLRVTMSSDFFWSDKEVDEKQADDFLAVNAPSFLMSYIRTTVANLTEQAEIQTQHIPFMDFAHASSQQDKHSSSDE